MVEDKCKNEVKLTLTAGCAMIKDGIDDFYLIDVVNDASSQISRLFCQRRKNN